MVFTMFSKAQSSWLFEVTAILKAQSSKAWYLQCSEHGIHEVTSSGPSGSSTSSKQTGDSIAKPISKAWYLLCLARPIRRLSRAKHGIYCV